MNALGKPLSKGTGLTEARLREAIVEAIEYLKTNGWNERHNSSKWDLVYDRVRFPPKEVAGTAFERLGRQWNKGGGRSTSPVRAESTRRRSDSYSKRSAPPTRSGVAV